MNFSVKKQVDIIGNNNPLQISILQLFYVGLFFFSVNTGKYEYIRTPSK